MDQNLVHTQELIHKRFLPDNYNDDLYLIVSNLKQGQLSVKEYIMSLNNSRIGVFLMTN